MDPNYIFHYPALQEKSKDRKSEMNQESNHQENEEKKSENKKENPAENKQEEIEENTKQSKEPKWYTLSKEQLEQTVSGTQEKIIKAIDDNLNSATKSQKYIFKIWDAVQSFQIAETGIGVILCIAAILAIAFTIFIADPLIVGGRRYILKARKENNTKLETSLEVFRKENWMNVAKIMLMRNIFNALWYLTIIGGIIKTYEYRMIPYLLAENPRLDRKEAFAQSKQMMAGNKWKTFILDMSFFGWNFISLFTFGLLRIFFVNPYNAATIAELYVTLQEKNEKPEETTNRKEKEIQVTESVKK
jgi:hypothetical protein